MKTKFRNLGLALVFAIAAMGVSASEFSGVSENHMEPEMGLEAWMTDWTLFDAEKAESNAGTVVDIAVSNPDFSILVEAVSKAGLAEALSAQGPFTVFAPTNAAFEKLFGELGVNGIEDLTAEQLTPILTYHVVSGKVMSSDLTNTSVGTLNEGKSIKIDLTDGVKINDSKVVTADITGENGVIHVIDKVLIPAAEKSSSTSGCSN
jgi:transforming growth factor-beta-induced protein